MQKLMHPSFLFAIALFTFGVIYILSAVRTQHRYFDAAWTRTSIIRNNAVEIEKSRRNVEFFSTEQKHSNETVPEAPVGYKHQTFRSVKSLPQSHLTKQFDVYPNDVYNSAARVGVGQSSSRSNSSRSFPRQRHQTSRKSTRRERFNSIIAGLFDNAVKRAVTPLSGAVWPLPHSITRPVSTVYRLIANKFKFVFNKKDYWCDILDDAVQRYMREIQDFDRYNTELHKVDAQVYTRKEANDVDYRELYRIHVVVNQKECVGQYPQSDMNESYILRLTDTEIPSLKADTIWGILRGLETFYQLLYIPFEYDQSLHLRAVDITDRPDMSHRGILIDTSRHFISVAVIKENLDAMAQNKLNVMHWHIVDDNSFPYQSKQFPELSKKGAYAPNLVYTHKDITEVIDYARLRGIRVMPEFDSPGHTRSWFGQPGLLAECGEGRIDMTGVFDISNENNFNFLFQFFKEIRSVFKDDVLHLGGDEVSVKCWYLNENILQLLENNTHEKLLEMYFMRLHKIIKSIDPKWQTVVWNEAAKYYKKLEHGQMIVEDWQHSIYHLLSMGYDVIYAKCWYLSDFRNEAPDWFVYYDCDPRKEAGRAPRKGRILGGEACMWSEYVDDNLLIQRLWPRAIAPAERLWSAPTLTSSSLEVQSRFQEQSCRMARRGIRVSPANGPGNCNGKVPYDKDPTIIHAQIPLRQ